MKAHLFALVASLTAFGSATAQAESRTTRAVGIGNFETTARPAIVVSVARPISRSFAVPVYEPAPGYWQDVAVKVRVPAGWTLTRNRWGGAIRVFEPAHFTFVTNRVWLEAGGRGASAICRR